MDTLRDGSVKKYIDDITQQQSDNLAHSNLDGSIGIKSKGFETFHEAIENAVDTPFDVVIFNDSLDYGSTTSHPWTWRFGKRLARACGTPFIKQGLVYAKASGHPTMDTCEGTLTETTTGGWGAVLASGQTASHTTRCDGWVVGYTAGSGNLVVRDGGPAGTILATINTASVSGSGNVWQSGALSAGNHTIHITATGGSATLDFVMPHLGTRTKGGRVWQISHGGWTNLSYADTPSTGLNLVENLQPKVVIIETGTNAVTTYADEIDNLVNAVRGVSPNSLVVVVIPPRSQAIPAAEISAARAVIETLGVPTVDWDKLIPDYGAALVVDGVHPTLAGTEIMASIAWAMMSGDPLGYAAREGIDATNTQLLEVQSALATEIRLVSSWQSLSEGGALNPKIVMGKDGQNLVNVTASPAISDANAGKLDLQGELTIDTPGDGDFRFTSLLNQPQLSLYTISTNPHPSMTIGSTFSIPLISFGSGTSAQDTVLAGIQGQLRAGLSGDGIFYGGLMQNINAQTGTSYTLVSTDMSKIITRNNSAASTQNFPQNSSAAIPVGTQIRTINLGTGTVTLQAGSGATLAGDTALTTNKTALVTKISTNGWLASIVGGTAGSLIDEDNMASNTDTQAPTQQSVKAYVDYYRNITLAANTGGTAFSNTTVETSVQAAAITVNAGTLRNGDTIELEYGGEQLNSSGAANTIVGRFKLNGTAVTNIGNSVSQGNAAFAPHYLHQFKLTRTSNTTFLATGSYFISTPLNTGITNMQVLEDVVTVSNMDSNNLTIDFTYQWGTAHANSSVTPQVVRARIIRG